MHKLNLYHVVCDSVSTFVLNVQYALSVNITIAAIHWDPLYQTQNTDVKKSLCVYAA